MIAKREKDAKIAAEAARQDAAAKLAATAAVDRKRAEEASQRAMKKPSLWAWFKKWTGWR